MNTLYRGTSENVPEIINVKAGELTACFCNGELRNVMIGDIEIVRRIYVAIRDNLWNTIRPTLTKCTIKKKKSSFMIDFNVENTRNNVKYQWHGIIEGKEDSTISFLFFGKADSTFETNRIGFCVLHPLRESVGKVCVIETSEGLKIKGIYPKFINPHQLFVNIKSISQKVTRSISSLITFSGDVFEMEDQRNWTDATFKTYCTPLAKPHPWQVKKGDATQQQVVISVKSKKGNQRLVRKNEVIQGTLVTKAFKVPQIGVCMSTSVSKKEQAYLIPLGLSHIRINIDVPCDNLQKKVAMMESVLLGCCASIELALFFEENYKIEVTLQTLLDDIQSKDIRVMRILVFSQKVKVTPRLLTEQIGTLLRIKLPKAEIVLGTDSYFVEINRNPPAVQRNEGVCYSVNPQVHTFDDEVLIDNIEGQAQTVQTTKVLFPTSKIYVSPITLRPRLNPDLPQKDHGPDPRQKSLFGAVWTLGSIMSLARSGATGATYYEVNGASGIMDTKENMVFPLYHVLADVNECPEAKMRVFDFGFCSPILGCELSILGKRRFCIANTSLRAQNVKLSGLSKNVYERYLDETTFKDACQNPNVFRKENWEKKSTKSGIRCIKLLPYSIVTIDTL